MVKRAVLLALLFFAYNRVWVEVLAFKKKSYGLKSVGTIKKCLTTLLQRQSLAPPFEMVSTDAHSLAGCFSCVKNASAYLNTRYNLVAAGLCIKVSSDTSKYCIYGLQSVDTPF